MATVMKRMKVEVVASSLEVEGEASSFEEEVEANWRVVVGVSFLWEDLVEEELNFR